MPYSQAAYMMYDELDRLSMDVLRFCQTRGVAGVIVPADVPYLHWDEENRHGQAILSLKHAAVLAGLGIMGRSTIFINKTYGNMVYLGAVLLDAELESDPLVEDFSCPPRCTICRDRCPRQAIGPHSVLQKACREHSIRQAGRGWDIYACNECRLRCPLRLGA